MNSREKCLHKGQGCPSKIIIANTCHSNGFCGLRLTHSYSTFTPAEITIAQVSRYGHKHGQKLGVEFGGTKKYLVDQIFE